MTLDRFVLILVLVPVAVAMAVFAASLLVAGFVAPGPVLLVAIPVALVGAVFWCVIAERLRERRDDRYDEVDN